MRLLVLSSWCPYPPDNGTRLRVYHLTRQLAVRGHQLKMLALGQEESDLEAARVGMATFCLLGVEMFRSRFFRPGTARALLGFLSSRPRHLLDTYQEGAARAIRRECLMGGYDAVVAMDLGVAHYVPRAAPVPAVLAEIEISGFLKAVREAGSARARLRRRLTLAKQRAHVAALGRQYALWIAASDAEAAAVRQIAGDGVPPVHVLSNGVDLDGNPFDPAAPYDPEGLVYNGALNFEANRDAVRWFAEAILPIIQRERPRACLRVTGRNDSLAPGDPLRRQEGVVLTGYLEDIRPTVRAAAVCVAPLRQGQGTRLKILEAMALGTPVVATTRGAEGIAVTPGEDILIADAPAEFAAAVLRLMREPDLRARVAAAGRRLVERRYGWDALGAQLEAAMTELIATGKKPTCPSVKD